MGGQFRSRVFLVSALLLSGALVHGNAIGPDKPLNRTQILGLLTGGVSNERVTNLVKERGIDFPPTKEIIRRLRQAGADKTLILAVRSANLSTAGSARANAARPDAIGHKALAENCHTAGARLLQTRCYREAEIQYRAGLRASPDDPSLRFALADALGEQGKWDEAAAEYRAVLKADPNNPFAMNNLAAMMEKTGDPSAAIKEYQRALQVEPTSAALHNNLALALQKKGDVNGAMEEFRRAIEAYPSESHAHNNLGLALESQGDLDEALKEYRTALKLDKGCCLALYSAIIPYVVRHKPR